MSNKFLSVFLACTGMFPNNDYLAIYWSWELLVAARFRYSLIKCLSLHRHANICTVILLLGHLTTNKF